MPAKSKKQQQLFGIAHAIQTGKMDPSKASGAARDIAKKVSGKDVRDFASTKHKGLPEKKDKEKTACWFRGYFDAYTGEYQKYAFVDAKTRYKLYTRGTPEEQEAVRLEVRSRWGVPFSREDAMILAPYVDAQTRKASAQGYRMLKARLLGYPNSEDMELDTSYAVRLRRRIWEKDAGIKMSPGNAGVMYSHAIASIPEQT